MDSWTSSLKSRLRGDRRSRNSTTLVSSSSTSSSASSSTSSSSFNLLRPSTRSVQLNLTTSPEQTFVDKVIKCIDAIYPQKYNPDGEGGLHLGVLPSPYASSSDDEDHRTILLCTHLTQYLAEHALTHNVGLICTYHPLISNTSHSRAVPYHRTFTGLNTADVHEQIYLLLARAGVAVYVLDVSIDMGQGDLGVDEWIVGRLTKSWGKNGKVKEMIIVRSGYPSIPGSLRSRHDAEADVVRTEEYITFTSKGKAKPDVAPSDASVFGADQEDEKAESVYTIDNDDASEMTIVPDGASAVGLDEKKKKGLDEEEDEDDALSEGQRTPTPPTNPLPAAPVPAAPAYMPPPPTSGLGRIVHLNSTLSLTTFLNCLKSLLSVPLLVYQPTRIAPPKEISSFFICTSSGNATGYASKHGQWKFIVEDIWNGEVQVVVVAAINAADLVRARERGFVVVVVGEWVAQQAYLKGKAKSLLEDRLRSRGFTGKVIVGQEEGGAQVI